MIDELGDAPAELRELIAAERARVPRLELRGVLRAKLAASISAAGTAGATAATAVGLKILLVVAVLGGGGAGLATFAHGRAAVASVAPPLLAMPVSEPIHVADVAVAANDAARSGDARVPPPPRPPAVTGAVRVAPPAASAAAAAVAAVAAAVPPPSDATLLAAALRALSSHDAARALALAQRDAALYPSSPLDEERDAIRIRALAALGRTDEARPLAAAFVAAHPKSIHRHLVENLQESP